MILKIAVFPVDVRVHGNVVPLEDDDGGVEGVLGAEAEGQRERLALVQSVRRAQHVDRPTGKRAIHIGVTISVQFYTHYPAKGMLSTDDHRHPLLFSEFLSLT